MIDCPPPHAFRRTRSTDERPDEMECPYCYNVMRGLRDVVDSRRAHGSAVSDCEHCEKPVLVRWEVSITYEGVVLKSEPTEIGTDACDAAGSPPDGQGVVCWKRSTVCRTA